MSRYLTPLPRLLAGAVETAVNRALELDDAAGQRLRPLADRCVRLQLTGLSIDLFFVGRDDRIEVSAETAAAPDASISGTPIALLAMAVPDWRAAGSGVRIDGDAGTAQAFERLLKQLDPDWEALFVESFGTVVGHQLWRILVEAGDAGRHVTTTAAEQTARFLRQESGLLVTREDVERFADEVDELREAVDRLEARIRRGRRS
jgi:ubiquinone biosynthesis protein UbiJ